MSVSTCFQKAWALLKMPYHGTNDKAAKKIMIEGLKPHFNENSKRMGIPEVVFATDDYEEALAHAEDDTYGTDLNPVVIHISDEVKPADDSYAPWYLYDKIIPPDKLRVMQKSFETAWDLAKMPIVQGSVYRNYDHDDEDSKRYGALFEDPKTGEKMGMEAMFHPKESISATIQAPVDDTYKLHSRAFGNFEGFPSGLFGRPTFESTGIGTDYDYRRRGYATAIYDLVAYILDRHGADLVPSSDQTKAGEALWDSILGNTNWAELGDDELRWRIRGDLG